MRSLIILFVCLVVSCSTSTGPIAPDTRQVVIAAAITPDGNPYRDLWVITDMDSIIRGYVRDTIDTITLPRGQKIAFLWYRDAKPGSMVWTPMTVTRDANVFFNGELTL